MTICAQFDDPPREEAAQHAWIPAHAPWLQVKEARQAGREAIGVLQELQRWDAEGRPGSWEDAAGSYAGKAGMRHGTQQGVRLALGPVQPVAVYPEGNDLLAVSRCSTIVASMQGACTTAGHPPTATALAASSALTMQTSISTWGIAATPSPSRAASRVGTAQGRARGAGASGALATPPGGLAGSSEGRPPTSGRSSARRPRWGGGGSVGSAGELDTADGGPVVLVFESGKAACGKGDAGTNVAEASQAGQDPAASPGAVQLPDGAELAADASDGAPVAGDDGHGDEQQEDGQQQVAAGDGDVGCALNGSSKSADAAAEGVNARAGSGAAVLRRSSTSGTTAQRQAAAAERRRSSALRTSSSGLPEPGGNGKRSVMPALARSARATAPSAAAAQQPSRPGSRQSVHKHAPAMAALEANGDCVLVPAAEWSQLQRELEHVREQQLHTAEVLRQLTESSTAAIAALAARVGELEALIKAGGCPPLASPAAAGAAAGSGAIAGAATAHGAAAASPATGAASPATAAVSPVGLAAPQWQQLGSFSAPGCLPRPLPGVSSSVDDWRLGRASAGGYGSAGGSPYARMAGAARAGRTTTPVSASASGLTGLAVSGCWQRTQPPEKRQQASPS